MIWQSKYIFFILNIFAAFSNIWLLKKRKKMQILWNYYSQKYSVFSSKKNYCVDAFVCIFFLQPLPFPRLTPDTPRWSPPIQWYLVPSHSPRRTQFKLQFLKHLIPQNIWEDKQLTCFQFVTLTIYFGINSYVMIVKTY